MKKNKLHLIISTIILVLIFGTAAICNQCGIMPPGESSETSGEGNKSEAVSETTQLKKSNAKETVSETTAGEEETAEKSDESGREEIIDFTFEPKSGPEGTNVDLILSEKITTSATVHFNGLILPKKISSDGKTFTVTIPVGSSTGPFAIEYDGKSVQSAEPFTVTLPPYADLEITNIGPVATDRPEKIFVDIKNVGTADLNDADIHVMCSAFGILRSDTNKTIPAFSDDMLKISLSAGGTGHFNPSLTIDVSLYSYSFVDCKIELVGDPTPNEFSISIP